MYRPSSGNSRIIKRKINGDVSYAFSVVRHVRILGKSCHTPLATIGTFRQSEFAARAEEFWQIVDEKLDALVRENKLWEPDAEKVRNKFAAVIERPAPVIKPLEASRLSESNLETIRRVLAERGFTI